MGEGRLHPPIGFASPKILQWLRPCKHITLWNTKLSELFEMKEDLDMSSQRLKDISTLDFSTPSFNPGPFNPRLFNHELFNPMVQKFMVEKSGVEMFMVEKSGVERSRVEAWGWKVQGWDVLQLIGQHYIHLGNSNTRGTYSSPWAASSLCKIK